MKTKYRKVRPNEVTSSNKFNNMHRNSADDIAELYKNYIGLKNKVEVHNLLSPINNDTILENVQALETVVNNIDSGITAISMYSMDNIIYPSSLETQYKCRHEYKFGEVVLPIASSFIEYNYVDPTTGKKAIIQNAHEYIKSFLTNNRYKPRVDQLHENSHINAIDQNNNNIHIAKAITSGNNVDNVSMVYNLETVETRELNTIRIYPVPEMISKYEKVSLSGPSLTDSIVTNYDGDSVEFLDDDDNPILSGKKRTFRFEDTEIDNVSIVLYNDSYDQIGNDKRQFVVGSRLISLENNVYMAEGWVGLKIDCSSKTGLTNITTDYTGETNNIEVYVYKSLEAFNEMEGHDLYGSIFTIQGQDLDVTDTDNLYILYKLTKHDNKTTPIIKGCTLEWEV